MKMNRILYGHKTGDLFTIWLKYQNDPSFYIQKLKWNKAVDLDWFI